MRDWRRGVEAGVVRMKVRRVRMLRPLGVGKGRGLGIGEVYGVGRVSGLVGSRVMRATYEIGGKFSADCMVKGDGVVAYLGVVSS